MCISFYVYCVIWQQKTIHQKKSFCLILVIPTKVQSYSNYKAPNVLVLNLTNVHHEHETIKLNNNMVKSLSLVGLVRGWLLELKRKCLTQI